jgi:FkbM family methyltransferase
MNGLRLDQWRRGILLTNAVALRWTRGFARNPVTFVDFGARGGLSRPWQNLYRAGMVSPIFFDPEPLAAQALLKKYPKAVIEPKAAWDTAGKQDLYVTEEPGCSSLLRPVANPQLVREPTGKYEVVKVVTVETVRAETCPSVAAAEAMVVKADVQGGELHVLNGFGEKLKNVCCCELEVSYTPLYENHPTAGQVCDFMFQAGFGLFEMRPFGIQATRHAVQANAYFCRRNPTTAREKDVERLFLLANGIGPRF